jgi:hypothetical protein
MHFTIDRVPWRAHRMIGSPAADGELHHLCHTDDDSPRVDEALDGWSGGRNSLRRIALRPKPRGSITDLREVLDSDRHAVQGTHWTTLRCNPIQFFGPPYRTFSKNLDESVQFAVLCVDRVETTSHDRKG